jgi:serine protease Do
MTNPTKTPLLNTRRRGFVPVLAALAALAVLVLAQFAGDVFGNVFGNAFGNFFGSASSSELQAQQNNPSSQASRNAASGDVSQSRQNAITRAVAVCSPAIVGINVTEVREYQYRDPFADDPFFGQFFGGRRQPQVYRQQVQGLGSGFIASSDGYIITNDHVAGHATKVVVTMAGGEKYDAKVIGSDPTSDVCLLKIEQGKKDDSKDSKDGKDGKDSKQAAKMTFPFLKLANSDEVMVGEWAIAFGNPFGLFDINAKPTVTVGVVSNTGVSLTPQEGRVYRNMIQTDAAISSGNSGGPLANALGEVIGMNTIIYSTAQGSQGAGSIGIGFAIPVNRVKRIVELLKKDGAIDRDFNVGLRVQQVDERIAKYLDLKRAEGVVVSEITYGSPAEKAGFEPGDLILDIDGQKVTRDSDALTIVNDAMTGQTLTFGIQRGEKKMTKTLTLDKRKK